MNRKHLSFIVILIFFVGISSGCIRQSPGSPAKERFYGTWQSTTNETIKSSDDIYYLTLYSNGTFILVMGETIVKNTWGYSSDKIPSVVFHWESGEDYYLPLFLSDDHLRLVGQSGNFIYFSNLDLIKTIH